MTTNQSNQVPLSVQEERMLQRLDQWGKNAWGRNLYMAFRLQGDLNESALSDALDELVRGQDNLRARVIKKEGGGYIKEIADAAGARFGLEIEEAPNATQEQISKLIIEQIQKPLHPEEGISRRGKLFRIADKDWVLVVVFHHVVFDASCYGVLVKEINALYRAALEGKLGSYEHPKLTMTDFANWQRNLLKTPRYEEVASYWKSFWPPVQPLKDGVPTDNPRGSGVRRRAIIQYDIPQDLLKRIRAAATAQRVTLPTFACAAATSLMARLSGRDDVTIGYVHSLRSEYSLRNRDQKDTLERVIGTFVAPLPVRVPFKETPTGNDVLAWVHRSLMQGFMNFDLPALDFLDPALGKGQGHQAIFPVISNYHRTRTELSLAGVKAERFRRDLIELPSLWAPQNELEWRIVESGAPVSGVLVYDNVLWSEQSAKRMTGQFIEMLERLADHRTESVLAR